MTSESDALDQGFYGIPSTKERAKMSPEKLAILLSQQERGTPAYILIEHELNLRIVKVQSNATLIASLVGIVGLVVGALLTVWLQAPHNKPAINEHAPQGPAGAITQNKLVPLVEVIKPPTEKKDQLNKNSTAKPSKVKP